jgi:hypothetical protein
VPQLSQDELTFVAGVSTQTGIDPRVLLTWIKGEGSPGDQVHNYMNITASTARYNASRFGSPQPSGETIPTNNPTAEFASVQDGIAATVAEIRSLGLTRFKGETPRQEIADIAATNWASSHYGGPGGPNLQRDFAGLFGSAALDSSYQSGSRLQSFAVQLNRGVMGDITSGAGALVDTGLGALTLIPGVNASAVGLPNTPGAQQQAASWLKTKLGDPFAFFTSWRFAEVVGGALLLLVGLVLLGRQFGARSPVPVPGG